MNRRGFITAGLVLAAAPMIVRAESIMPVKKLGAPEKLYLPDRSVLTLKQIQEIAKTMRSQNIRAVDGFYYAHVSPRMYGLMVSSGFIPIHQYTEKHMIVKDGEIGRYNGGRVFA